MQLTERVFHFTFKCKFVVQKVTNVLQSKVNEDDESEWNTRSGSF